jgi:ethanolamine ammonia-lyase small subunit
MRARPAETMVAVESATTVDEQWRLLRSLTRARVGLGRAGVSLPTSHLLAFEADHALARDAVQEPFDANSFATRIMALGLTAVTVSTLVSNREEYLKRPDRGRRLTVASRDELGALARAHRRAADASWDIVFLVSDGLSAAATTGHAIRLLAMAVPLLEQAGLAVGPVVVAPYGRVGLLNDVGATMFARSAAILLGERPGLSAPDGLSAYFEFRPGPQLTDADRNCISNIRVDGLPPEQAAVALATLIREATRARISGTRLKIEYPDPEPALGSGDARELGTGSDQRG